MNLRYSITISHLWKWYQSSLWRHLFGDSINIDNSFRQFIMIRVRCINRILSNKRYKYKYRIKSNWNFLIWFHLITKPLTQSGRNSLTHTHTPSLDHSLTLSLTHTHAHTHTHSVPQSFSHSLTQSFNQSVTLWLSHLLNLRWYLQQHNRPSIELAQTNNPSL